MPSPFDYAAIRIVPRPDREEFLNAGVILFCLERRYLSCRTGLDSARLQAFSPALDPAETAAQLDAIPRLCAGEADAGPIAHLSQRERFHWLVSPRSTVIQTSPVHTGLTEDPEETLRLLYQKLVEQL